MRFKYAGLALIFLTIAMGPLAAQELPKIEVVPQVGHSAWVWSFAMSTDGKTGLSSSRDNTIKVWDLETGQLVRSLFGHSNGVTAVALSPDGKRAISTGWDLTIKYWDIETGRTLRTLTGAKAVIWAVALSADGKTVLSGGGQRFSDGGLECALKLWDLETGAEIRTFLGHSALVDTVALSPDGKTALSSSGRDGTIKLWDVATGQVLQSFRSGTAVSFSPDGKFAVIGRDTGLLSLLDLAAGQETPFLSKHGEGVGSVSVSSNGKFAFSGGGDKMLKLWDLPSGKLVRTLPQNTSAAWVSVSTNGDTGVSYTFSLDGLGTLAQWDLSSGKEVRRLGPHSGGYSDTKLSLSISANGKTAVAGTDNRLKVWDLSTGHVVRALAGRAPVSVSADGVVALSGGDEKTFKVWDLATGNLIRVIPGQPGVTQNVAISADGKTALAGDANYGIKLWDLRTGEELRSLSGHPGGLAAVAISADGKIGLSGGNDNFLKLWDLTTGKLLQALKHSNRILSVALSADGTIGLTGICDDQGTYGLCRHATLKVWDLATGTLTRSLSGHLDDVWSVSLSPDGKSALSGSDDNTVKLWDLSTGRAIHTFTGHSGGVRSVALSSDDGKALSTGYDGTLRLWDLAKGDELVQMRDAEAEWLAILPSKGGFFAASKRDSDLVAIAQGLKAIGIGQVYQSIYNPDLVREALAGDPDHEVERAAKVVSLDKVLDSGPAPVVEITSPSSGDRTESDLVTLAIKVRDRGKGIGRIEWRVNGITVGVTYAPASSGADYESQRELSLDPGENTIEVVAYNARNLLASVPARIAIAYNGSGKSVKPKLHVLAIGINAYEDHGWTPSGSSQMFSFPPLSLAVDDAKAFAAEMEKAAGGLYSEVRVRKALDVEATLAGLDHIVQEMSAEISPRDTFVFYVGAHGYSVDGSFYIIPKDYDGGPNPDTLKSRGIGQDKLQDWVANRIKAKKALFLLDTCESGALTNGYVHSRVDAAASEVGMGRLHEATGRPVLTAAGAGKNAYEGYKGHGVFTYALIEALHKGDANGNGTIEVAEIAAYVEKRVPELFAELKSSGWVVKGLPGEVEQSGQSAHFGSIGEDYPLVTRLP